MVNWFQCLNRVFYYRCESGKLGFLLLPDEQKKGAGQEWAAPFEQHLMGVKVLEIITNQIGILSAVNR